MTIEQRAEEAADRFDRSGDAKVVYELLDVYRKFHDAADGLADIAAITIEEARKRGKFLPALEHALRAYRSVTTRDAQ